MHLQGLGVLIECLAIIPAYFLISCYAFFVVRPLKPGYERLTWGLPLIPVQMALPFVFDQELNPVCLAIFFCLSWLEAHRTLALCFGRGVLAGPWASLSLDRFHLAFLLPLHLGPPLLRIPSTAEEGSLKDGPSQDDNVRIDSSSRGPPKTLANSTAVPKKGSSEAMANSTAAPGKGPPKTMANSVPVLAAHTALKLFLFYLIQHMFRWPNLSKMAYNAIYTIGLFIFITIVMQVTTLVLMVFYQIELEPQFNSPLIADSFQRFWSDRWNRTVSFCLRDTFYQPTQQMVTSWLHTLDPAAAKGPRISRFPFASLAASFVAFFASGVFHELAVLYMSSTMTGEMMAFFLIHFCLVSLEVWLRRLGALKGIPQLVAIPFVTGTTFVLAHYLFFEPLCRTGACDRVINQVHSWFRS